MAEKNQEGEKYILESKRSEKERMRIKRGKIAVKNEATNVRVQNCPCAVCSVASKKERERERKTETDEMWKQT